MYLATTLAALPSGERWSLEFPCQGNRDRMPDGRPFALVGGRLTAPRGVSCGHARTRSAEYLREPADIGHPTEIGKGVYPQKNAGAFGDAWNP
ncbi:hypothetical protein GCM10010983_45660 [Caulobacter rhizosphaerae]|nr:hypothetical protein GCM10010983_45660 [Caulobacter rhizosphaerae]